MIFRSALFLTIISLEAAALMAQKNTTPLVIPASPTETMAWIYPGDPSCEATNDYKKYQIDVLKPEYFLVSDQGELRLLTEEEDGCNGFSIENLKEIKEYSKSQYVTVAASNINNIENFLDKTLTTQEPIEKLVNFVVQNNIEGVEIDFEAFSAWDQTDYENYKRFLTLLGEKLHQNEKKLMVDGPAIGADLEQSYYLWNYKDFLDLPVDKIVVMAYDYQYDYGAGTAISPLKWLQNVATRTLRDYPNPSKITIGLPSYGYKAKKNSYSFELLTHEQMMFQPGFSLAKRDPKSKELKWQHGGYMYFYNDSTSLTEKKKLLEKLGLNSISVWHLGGNPWFE